MDFGLKQGDAGTPIQAILYNPDGTPVDLNGAAVRFIMAKSGGSSSVQTDNQVMWEIKIDAQAEIFDADAGTVQYIFTAEDVNEFGDFLGEFEVTYPSGRIETFPNGRGQIRIQIYPDIR